MVTITYDENNQSTPVKKGRKVVVVLTITAVVMAFIGGGGYTAYQHANASEDKVKIVDVKVKIPSVVVEIPEVKTITEWDRYAGRFEAINEVELRSRVTGYLQQVHFKDGDMVEKGDLLFSIDPRPFETNIKMAEASIAEAKASLHLARSDLQRSTTLVKASAISKQHVDQDRASVQQAQAQLASARSELERAKLDLDFATIEAPIAGRIDARNVDIGNLIRGDDENASPLTNIVSLDPIYIVFDIDQNAYLNYYKKEAEGVRKSSRTASNPVNIALQGEIAYPHKAKMDFVANRIDEQTGTIRCRAIIDNPDGLFTPGLFARVQLLSRDNSLTILIPDKAIALEQTNRVVYVVNKENKVESRAVILGPIIDGKRVIRAGLKGDERIITKGLHRISVGITVQTELKSDQTTKLTQVQQTQSKTIQN